MGELYKRFALTDHPDADFSADAAMAMYLRESTGKPLDRTERVNGYAFGKKCMDITIAYWKEDVLSGGLLVDELLADGLPEWFLKRIGVFDMRPSKGACAWWIDLRTKS